MARTVPILFLIFFASASFANDAAPISDSEAGQHTREEASIPPRHRSTKDRLGGRRVSEAGQSLSEFNTYGLDLQRLIERLRRRYLV
jgi:hypothetical protein